MLTSEPTCAICGARLNQLTIVEHGLVKRYSCWCVNPDCMRSGVMLDHAEEALLAVDS